MSILTHPPHLEYMPSVGLLVQNLLSVHNVDALSYIIKALAGEVVDASEYGLCGCRGKRNDDAVGIDGREGLVAYAFQLEGVDAEAGLSGKIYDDTQRDFGFLGERETEAAVYKLAPSQGFLFTLRVAYHGLALAYNKAAALRIVAVAELDAELVFSSGKGYGLPQAVVEKRSGKTAPLCLEGDVAVVSGINVRSGGNASADNGVGILPS